jgi:hypothetical protein
MMGELLEQEGRHTDAIAWAQAELQDPSNFNVLSKTRAGRLLGRCHAALNEHTLSVAVLDAALQLAKTGELLFTEALTVRERVMLGNGTSAAGTTSSSSSLHWDEHTGKQQLAEVMGRMQGGHGLLQKLLL